ncbi:MAG: folylpolyglutamate synthase/dihydrofolate synthase family protein [Erysipelotrichaceae bacterium]|nr:folylpolyglutamate synthase/dihydrofolate synthase family protein [Erysipelotrichaceae bacterium]
MNYQECIKYIEHSENKKRQTDNSRMFDLMDRLSHPQNKLHFIHVAGTNGKGSCVASLSSILQEAGYKVGMYTSPHLIKYEERMMINGKCISQKEFTSIASEIKDITDKMSKEPTVFEKLTAMAFVYFAKKKCDVVVLETGLGGRLDATNVIYDPDLCVLMNIGLEHTEVLGDTIEKIAKEKAGIIKENSDVIAYRSNPKALKIFKQVAKENNARLIIPNFNKVNIVKESINNQVFDYGDLKKIKLSLLGKHQFYNAATVIEACNILNTKGYKITNKNIKDGLRKTEWDARLSVLNKKPLFILDGAHNPQCAEALKTSLPKLLGNKKAVILCGMLKDKDYVSVMKMMKPFAKEFVCLTPDSSRALDANDLAEVIRKLKCKATVANSVKEGIIISLDKAKNNGVVIAFGSLYLAGYIKDEFYKAYKKWRNK